MVPVAFFMTGDQYMQTSHLTALKKKHEKLEQTIRKELVHADRDDALIGKIKKEKLFLKEEIERMQKEGRG